MRRDVGIFIALTLLATACASGSSDTAPDAAAAASTAVATTVATETTDVEDGPGAGSTDDIAPAAGIGAVPEPSGASESEPVPYEIPFELEFTATLVGGDPFDGTSVAGQDVLFWFWAPT